MDAKDLADLFITSTEKIEFYWNFYVVMLIALIGWLISTKRQLTLPLKLIISAGYLVFVFMNIQGLYGSYTFADAIRMDLLSLDELKNVTNTRQLLAEHSFLEKRNSIFWIHSILGLAVLLVIWFGRFNTDEK